MDESRGFAPQFRVKSRSVQLMAENVFAVRWTGASITTCIPDGRAVSNRMRSGAETAVEIGWIRLSCACGVGAQEQKQGRSTESNIAVHLWYLWRILNI